jgi:death on curing protein
LPNKGVSGHRVQFLTLDEVLEIHTVLIERFGGPSGVRDLGLLESALYRPRSGYYPELVEMAAALFESLVTNHPFVDGDKQVAFFATDVFLRLNGYRFQVEARAAHAFLMNLFETQCCDLAHLRPWIEDSIVAL